MSIHRFALAAASLMAPGVFAQSPAPTTRARPAKDNLADWPMYTRDLAGTRFSSLAAINTKNVSRLKVAWSVTLGPAPAGARRRGADPAAEAPPAAAESRGPAGPTANAEATPIVVRGILYLPAGNRILAFDAETGTQVWTAPLPFRTNARGVSYWPGDRENPPRILFTAGSRLVALNASTGKIDPGFGKEGIVDISVPWGGAPTIYHNPAARRGRFWQLDGRQLEGFSGTNVWGWYMTLDEKRGILYMPFGSPAGNYYGGDRPGNNLFGNSVVAVNALTGQYLWHFQTVHHDLWDSDLPPAPGLVDIKRNGKTLAVLAAIGKPAWMFILDRTNGTPVFGVEERPVPKGDVPGEWYSPTQPFPLKPPQLARNRLGSTKIPTW